MTNTSPKIFNQLRPVSVTPVQLYNVPAQRQAQVTLFVANQGGASEFFRIALVPDGQSLTTARYIAFDTPLIGNGIFAVTGIGLDSGDSIFVKSANGNLSFTATGIEFSP